MPTYIEDAYGPNGNLRKRKGQLYDLHHLIEQNYGGPHVWWNAQPASFPDQHQLGIHGKDSPAKELFK